MYSTVRYFTWFGHMHTIRNQGKSRSVQILHRLGREESIETLSPASWEGGVNKRHI